jgi:hypothetical protein
MSEEKSIDQSNCPICGGGNQCGNLLGKEEGACWCSKEQFPKRLFELVPEELLGAACICKSCLSRFKLDTK